MLSVICDSCGRAIPPGLERCSCGGGVTFAVVDPGRVISVSDLWSNWRTLVSKNWRLVLPYGLFWGPVFVVQSALYFFGFMVMQSSLQTEKVIFLMVTFAVNVACHAVSVALWEWLRAAQFGHELEPENKGKLWTKVFRAMIATLALATITATGSLFCLVPGLIAFVVFSPAPYLYTFERTSLLDAFRLSIDLIGRYQGPVLAGAGGVILLGFIVSIVFVFVTAFFTAISESLSSFGFLSGLAVAFVGGFVVWSWYGSVLTGLLHPNTMTLARRSEVGETHAIESASERALAEEVEALRQRKAERDRQESLRQEVDALREELGAETDPTQPLHAQLRELKRLKASRAHAEALREEARTLRKELGDLESSTGASGYEGSDPPTIANLRGAGPKAGMKGVPVATGSADQICGPASEESVSISSNTSLRLGVLSEIVKAHKLHESGVLTHDEFRMRRQNLFYSFDWSTIELSPEDALIELMQLRDEGVIENEELSFVKGIVLHG